MPICPCCERVTTYFPLEQCPDCYPAYQRALTVDNKTLPKAFQGGVPFDFELFGQLKRREASMIGAGVSNEEIDRRLEEWAAEVMRVRLEGMRSNQRMQAEQHRSNVLDLLKNPRHRE